MLSYPGFCFLPLSCFVSRVCLIDTIQFVDVIQWIVLKVILSHFTHSSFQEENPIVTSLIGPVSSWFDSCEWISCQILFLWFYVQVQCFCLFLCTCNMKILSTKVLWFITCIFLWMCHCQNQPVIFMEFYKNNLG